MFKRATVACIGPLGVAGSAVAAVPSEISDALSTMRTDALIVATAFVVAAVGVAAVKFMRQAIWRLPNSK